MKKISSTIFLLLLIAMVTFTGVFKELECKTENGNPESLFNLGLKYRFGSGVTQNMSKAAFYIKKAAEKNYSEAQHMLGYMFLEGEGVCKSYDKAIKWFSEAARNNHVRSQYTLGYLYESGEVIEKNLNKSIYYYRLAVLQEDPFAQYQLGNMYKKGKGLKKDNEQAFKLYLKSANQDYVKAQHALGLSYKEGKGVDQDYILSMKWFIIAVGRWRDANSFAEIIKLENLLSEDQLLMSFQLAKKWEPLQKYKLAEPFFEDITQSDLLKQRYEAVLKKCKQGEVLK